MDERTTDERSPLWIDRYAEITRVADVTDRIGAKSIAPHIFVTLVWGLEKGTILLTGTADPTPIWIAAKGLELAGLLLVASTAARLAARYEVLATDVETYGSVADDDPDDLGVVDRVLRRLDAGAIAAVWRADDEWVDFPAPPRLRRVLLGCGWLLHAIYLFALGNVDHVLSTQGVLPGSLSFFVIIPFVYYPIIAEFVSIIANVHVALPARIRSEGLLDFEDISGYGGLRPVGAVIESSGHRYVVGLIIYTLLTITTGIQAGAMSGNAETVAVDTLYLVVGTLVGILLFFYPVFSLHRFMTHQKDARLHAIADQVSRLEGDGTNFPEVNPETPDTASQYMQHFMNMNVVKEMHEYPIKLQQVTSVVTGLVIPYALEYGSGYILSII
ncbi:MAG: hypothetical protein ACQETB_05365 [Halobacteriota archaeon]